MHVCIESTSLIRALHILFPEEDSRALESNKATVLAALLLRKVHDSKIEVFGQITLTKLGLGQDFLDEIHGRISSSDSIVLLGVEEVEGFRHLIQDNNSLVGREMERNDCESADLHVRSIRPLKILQGSRTIC